MNRRDFLKTGVSAAVISALAPAAKLLPGPVIAFSPGAPGMMWVKGPVTEVVDYDAWMQMMLRNMARALDIPFSTLAVDYSDTRYASVYAVGLHARRGIPYIDPRRDA